MAYYMVHKIFSQVKGQNFEPKICQAKERTGDEVSLPPHLTKFGG